MAAWHQLDSYVASAERGHVARPEPVRLRTQAQAPVVRGEASLGGWCGSGAAESLCLPPKPSPRRTNSAVPSGADYSSGGLGYGARVSSDDTEVSALARQLGVDWHTAGMRPRWKPGPVPATGAAVGQTVGRSLGVRTLFGAL